MGGDDTMKRETLCVAYTGEAVDSGAMSVNDLAPALLALSNLIGAANRLLNNDESTVDVRLNAHLERGSFEMSFEIIQSLSDQIKLLFNDSYSIEDILNHIGLFCTVSGFTGVTLFQLIRWIRNRKIDKVEETDKKTIKISIEEEVKEVSTATWTLYKSHRVKQQLEGVLHPLTKDGVESFEVRDKKNEEVTEKITKEEISLFSTPTDEILSTKKAIVKILSVNFEKGLKWKFNSGDSKFLATVNDDKFMEDVEKGKISFKAGDTLIVELETRQQIFFDTVKETIKVVKVEKVISNGEVVFDSSVEL